MVGKIFWSLQFRLPEILIRHTLYVHLKAFFGSHVTPDLCVESILRYHTALIIKLILEITHCVTQTSQHLLVINFNLLKEFKYKNLTCLLLFGVATNINWDQNLIVNPFFYCS